MIVREILLVKLFPFLTKYKGIIFRDQIGILNSRVESLVIANNNLESESKILLRKSSELEKQGENLFALLRALGVGFDVDGNAVIIDHDPPLESPTNLNPIAIVIQNSFQSNPFQEQRSQASTPAFSDNVPDRSAPAEPFQTPDPQLTSVPIPGAEGGQLYHVSDRERLSVQSVPWMLILKGQLQPWPTSTANADPSPTPRPPRAGIG